MSRDVYEQEDAIRALVRIATALEELVEMEREARNAADEQAARLAEANRMSHD